MLDFLKEGWRLECQLDEEAPTWTQVVEYNLDWYTNPEKRILTPFDPIGWDTQCLQTKKPKKLTQRG